MKKIILGVLAIIILVAGGYMAWLFNRPVMHVLPGEFTATGQFKHTEEAQYYKIDATYPNRTALFSKWSPAADEEARTTIETWLQKDIEEFKRNLRVNQISGPEKEMLDSTGRKYEYDATYKPFTSANAKLISYEYDIYIDTGGAHPNGYFKTFAFDKSGNEVKLADLFPPGSEYLQRLSDASLTQIKAQLTQRLGLPAQAGEDATASIFTEGVAPRAENFSNFVIDADTLVILFPPYQVAAYAAGTFEVRIPLSQLSDVLQPEWK